MSKGKPKDWTLEELQLIWTHDGSDGSSPGDHADAMGVARGTWYSIKGRLRMEGGPEALFAAMEESKTRRYNAAATRHAPGGANKQKETLDEALLRRYTIRIGRNGRGGTTPQYTVTVPPTIAEPFVALWGRDVTYEPREDGILIKPLPRPQLPEMIPAWVTPASENGSDEVSPVAEISETAEPSVAQEGQS